MSSFTQTIFGKSERDLEEKAQEAITAYAGSLSGWEWIVSADAVVNMAGEVIHYEGTVEARRGR